MMIKFHLVIVSAILIAGFLAKPATADLFPKCKDKKGKFHIGADDLMTCKELKKSKKYIESYCSEEKPSGGSPPAMEGCPKTCDTCNMCISLFSTYIGYASEQIFSYPQGCATTLISSGGTAVCPGTIVTIQPISLYLDDVTIKPANVTLMGAGNYFTNTTSLIHGVFNFPKSKKSKGGDLYFSTMTALDKLSAMATTIGGTGMFENVGGGGSLGIDLGAGLVEYQICPIFPKKKK